MAGNGTINCDIEGLGYDIHKTSTARQESTTKLLLGGVPSSVYGGTANNLQKDLYKCQREPVHIWKEESHSTTWKISEVSLGILG